jgi:hypothetical protein
MLAFIKNCATVVRQGVGKRWIFRGTSVAILAANLLNSVGALAQEPSTPIGTKGLYIVFLSSHCHQASMRDSPAAAADVAARLGITSIELAVVDRACSTSLSQEQDLRSEAIRRHQAAIAGGKDLDIATVRSFTERREAIAVASIQQIRSQLGPKSYEALDHFITTVLSGLVK